MSIGENLDIILKKTNITIAELSRLSGVKAQTLYAIKNRKSNRIAPDILFSICDTLNITIQDLIADTDISTDKIKQAVVDSAYSEEIKRIDNSIDKLNVPGLSRLADYSEELVATGMYKRPKKDKV